MNSLLQQLPGSMGDKARAEAMEQLKTSLETQIKDNAPGYVKCCFPCCGGPVKTVDRMQCLVPKDKKETVKKALDEYKEKFKV